MYRYRKYGIKQIEQPTSLLTKAQIRLYRAQAETIQKELEHSRLSNVSIDELIKSGAKQMEKDGFKIATEELNNL